MQFNDTTNLSGLIQDCEKWTNLGNGAISGDATLLMQFTADINNAFDEVLPLIFASDANWQWDDNNHDDYPIATVALVSGQADYTFVQDEEGNSVLEIFEAYVMDPTGIYRKLDAVDASTDRKQAHMLAQTSTNTGTPRRYDKLATSLFLDPIPNYSIAKGVRVVFSRSPSYFASTDTTKTPGIPVPFQHLLSLIPSRDWVAIHKPDNVALLQTINGKIAESKGAFSNFLSKRARDERPTIRTHVESSR